MTIHERFRKVVVAVLLCAASAWSQQGGQQSDQESTAPSPPTMTPDTRPLSGIESLGLGSLVGERSYVVPGFVIVQNGQSNATYQPGGQSGFQAATVLAGDLALRRLSRRNQFGLAYQGGGVLYESSSLPDSTYHLFGFSDSLSFRRAVFTLADRFSYLPGFYGGVGLGYGGAFSLDGLGSLPGLGTQFTPQRGILTNAAGYSNVVLAQLEYMPGARSSLTVVGGFQTLQSSQQGFVTSNTLMGQLGYNRSLTARDTISVFYSADLYHYTTTAQDITSQVFALSYGRRVTGRLAFQVFGGPEVFIITVPGHTNTQTSGYGGADLTYSWPKTHLSVRYFKGVSNGAGVLAGSSNNTVGAYVSRQFSAKWSGNLGVSYYYNSSLSVPGSTAPQHTYNYWAGTCAVTRTLGRYAHLALFYDIQTQNSNQSFSVGSSTGTSVLNNVFGIALRFNYRPIGI